TEHHAEIGDMLIRNVPTDIRSWGTVEENGNSIFVFEVDGLCIGHLGHLHHQPNDAQYAALGRLDVVMAAVDGSMTINQDEMVEILRRLRSSVVIPMHWFRPSTLERFLDRMAQDFVIERPGVSDYAVSLQSLPRQPTVVVLEPRLLRE
ncbi:MAG: MBL fold metallo-hydrolase, partial [Sphingomonadales bacterium]|nr:MBL fold metallo-hydrolase [Sphingomonadales bacterium]